MRFERFTKSARFVLVVAITSVWLHKPALLNAQFSRAAITGAVRDPSGAVIPGAEVTVTEERTGASVSVRSLADGVYLVPHLLPGSYRITVQMQGFKTVTLTGLTLNAGATLTRDIVLELGPTTESVEVTAETSLVETTGGRVGTVVPMSHVFEMPLVDRDVHKLVNLVPGSFHNNDERVSIAGSRLQTSAIQLDGIANSIGGLRNQNPDLKPPVDSLQEVKVEMNNFSAEYGRVMGGVINAVTKSGTNEFHGSLYEFVRNQAFDARGWGADVLPPLKRNNFGGTIGGPIRRNRTFFFVNEDVLLERSATTRTYSVGLPAWRTGAFSSATRDAGGRAEVVPIYDPDSGTGNFLYPRATVPFPGNIIPGSRLDPVAIKATSYLPNPNRPPDNPFNQGGNWQRNQPIIIETLYSTARLDHSWSDATKMFVRYMLAHPSSYKAGYLEGFGPATPDGDYGVDRRQNIAVNGTHLLSPNWFMNITGGYRRHKNARRTGDCCHTHYGKLLGVSNSPTAGEEPGGGFPRFNYGGGLVPVSAIGHMAAIDRFDATTSTADFTANFTQTRGRHTLRYGAQVTLYSGANFRADSAGTWTFDGRYTRGITATGASVPNTGINFADFLLGRLSSVTLTVEPLVHKKIQYYGGYVQDDWRLGSRLTLNIGLRYDTETPIYERHGRQSSFDPYAPNPRAGTADIPPGAVGITLFQNRQGMGKYLWKWQKLNFAPRFGFAWRASGSSDTVLRGGFGLFFGDPYGGIELLQSLKLGFVRSLQVGSPVPFLLRDGVPPGSLADVPESELGPTFGQRGTRFETQSIQYVDPNRAHPYAEMFNLTLQHEWKGILFEVAGLGNLGRHVPFVSYNMNVMRPEMLPRTDIPERLRRPWTVFGGDQAQVIQMVPNWGLSNYLALTFKSERRFRNGIGWLVSYAFTRWIDNVNSPNAPLGDNDQIQNVYDIQNERSLSTNCVPHRLVVSPIVDIPLGRARRWLHAGPFSQILGGWQVALIGTLQSGAPFGATVLNGPRDLLGDNAPGRVLRPHLVSSSLYTASKGQPAVGVRGKQWLNQAAFAPPPRFTFGNASRTLPKVLGPPLINWDSMIAKNLHVRERWRAQFRWEMFNMTNTPRWNLPVDSLGSGTFGLITGASSRRIMQFALKLYW